MQTATYIAHLQGDKGEPGPLGMQGERGAPGPRGDTGPRGKMGTDR